MLISSLWNRFVTEDVTLTTSHIAFLEHDPLKRGWHHHQSIILDVTREVMYGIICSTKVNKIKVIVRDDFSKEGRLYDYIRDNITK